MKYIFSEDEKSKMEKNPNLTYRQRDVFELVYRGGLYHQDAAEILHVSRKTIERELNVIRSVL